MTINQQDFITPITGNVVIQNNGARLVLQANADLNTLFEGDESFKLVLRKGSNTGPVVATTAVIIVRDTSNTITYNSLVESAGTIGEGDTVTFVLDTTNLGPNNTVYYNTTGNATSSLFAAGNTGSFITTGNAYTLSLATAATIPDNQTRFFQLQIREGSLSGPVKITSNVVTVVDALQAFVIATGGFVTIEDGYKTHHFTSSNTFAVSGLGLPTNRTVDYLIVAGGGSGGGSAGLNGSGGGGGAGGLLTGNTNSLAATAYPVAVGAGGAWLANGAVSTALSLNALGGGRGGAFMIVGAPHSLHPAAFGGSGGGGHYVSSPNGFARGTGTPGQGNNGGFPDTYRSGSGGGAGASGEPTIANQSTNGNGFAGGVGRAIPWIPAAYGTGGPAPGRWFAGGGGGGGRPGGPPVSLKGAGGAGGGGAGGDGFGSNPGIYSATATAGTAFTGGGGGGAGQSGPGSPEPSMLIKQGVAGGSGFVIIRYPYTVKTFNITDNLPQPGSILQGSNITYTLRTVNVSNNSVLYYTTSGNVTTSDFVGGNTGSVTVVAANAAFSISIANNIVSGGATKAFALQLREGSTSGPVVASANTVIVYSQDPNNFMSATGGTITRANGYSIHTFTSSNTFTIDSFGYNNIIEYLIIGGGGGGIAGYGGAGGAGGYRSSVSGESSGGGSTAESSLIPNVLGNYTVTVGAGGAGSGQDGNSSSIFSITSLGGGGVGTDGGGSPGRPGGSGGGGNGNGSSQFPVVPKSGGAGTSGQGYAGGTGISSLSDPTGGGGGGAGSIGANSPSGGVGGNGGSGVASSITGSPIPRAGGGGGGARVTSGTGGSGGGGAGSPGTGVSGISNTGGGGGGGYSGPTGGNGGSGVVIIRYVKP